MEQEQLIPLHEVCRYHEVELSFVQSLDEIGLITIRTVAQSPFIPLEQVAPLEQMIRLHHDLNINLEGLDVIHNMLSQMTTLQEEIRQLRNRLSFYDTF